MKNILPPSPGATPGPWTVHEFHGSEGHVVMAGNCHVAEVFGIKDTASRDPAALANARLIASAPALVAFVERVAHGEDGDAEDRSMALGGLEEAARALLAQIGGGR